MLVIKPRLHSSSCVKDGDVSNLDPLAFQRCVSYKHTSASASTSNTQHLQKNTSDSLQHIYSEDHVASPLPPTWLLAGEERVFHPCSTCRCSQQGKQNRIHLGQLRHVGSVEIADLSTGRVRLKPTWAGGSLLCVKVHVKNPQVQRHIPATE